MLLEQEKEIETLQAENAELKAKLEDKKVIIANAGTISDAALKLSGIFEAAQKAADIYLASVKPEEEDAEEEENVDENTEEAETVDQ